VKHLPTLRKFNYNNAFMLCMDGWNYWSFWKCSTVSPKTIPAFVPFLQGVILQDVHGRYSYKRSRQIHAVFILHLGHIHMWVDWLLSLQAIIGLTLAFTVIFKLQENTWKKYRWGHIVFYAHCSYFKPVLHVVGGWCMLRE